MRRAVVVALVAAFVGGPIAPVGGGGGVALAAEGSEAEVRVAFVDACPPGTLLGAFLTRANQAAKEGTPILAAQHVEELDKLREYVNQFHHKTSKNWQENLSNINEKALQGYARRVISFTRIAAP